MSIFARLNPVLPARREARAWIIGASYGIGAAVARALIAAGARVALSARDAGKLESVASGARKTRVLIEPLDVTAVDSAAAACERIATAWGRHRPGADRGRHAAPHQCGEAAVAILEGLRRGDFEIDFPKTFSRQMKLLQTPSDRLYFASVRRATRL
ncbi:MAG: SDR family NAD(P)-dependent oxidoreductase [Burkholderiales bacterium]